jgi:acyl-CoA hydrolase
MDPYRSKLRTAKEAVQTIRPGQRVFIGSGCGEPQHLVDALMDNWRHYADVEIIGLPSLEGSLLALMADETQGRNFNIRSIYQGSGQTKSLQANKRFVSPMPLSAVPNLFKRRQLPLHTALIQVSPPDEEGWMNLGISVDITLAAAQAAETVIAQVNPRLPRVPGEGIIHLDDVDLIVEKEEDLLSVFDVPEHAAAKQIAQLIAGFIDDGATIQIGLGFLSPAILQALADKNDLGVHTEFLTDDIMALADKGIITNRLKDLNPGKLVASGALGSPRLYEKLDKNPAVELHPSDYVNHPGIISRHHRMTAINMAHTIDLTGQVAADALPQNHFSGVTGMLNFVIGASLANEGKSIIALSAADPDKKESRVVAELGTGSVVIPKGYNSYVVSDFGAVNLFGKNIQERVMAMISLAHPDFRDGLFQEAKERGLIDRQRTLNETLFGVYPAKIEETITLDGREVTFRAVKPVDQRRIQEHFYTMDKEDIKTRFFTRRTLFHKEDIEGVFQVDYIKNLSIVAVTGEFGFGKVIGIGEYKLESGTTAEVAYSVSREWQGKGIAGILQKKLSDAAIENGITRFNAYVIPQNKSMIKLFMKLPYKITTTKDEYGAVVLTCDLQHQD